MRRVGDLLVLPVLSLILLLPSVTGAGERPSVAVFGVELGPRVKLPKGACSRFVDHLMTWLTRSDRYRVIPREGPRHRMAVDEPKPTQDRFDQSCQFLFGSWLAAEKTLVTRIDKLDERCSMTLIFCDLEKATTEAVASQHGGCEESQVLESVDMALGKLFGQAPDQPTPARPGQRAISTGPVESPNPAGLIWVNSAPAGIEFSKSEVTVAQYRACVQADVCTEPRSKKSEEFCNWEYADRDAHPVNCVDWYQATAFCQWAGGRLPTDAEWCAEASNSGLRTYPRGEEEAT